MSIIKLYWPSFLKSTIIMLYYCDRGGSSGGMIFDPFRQGGRRGDVPGFGPGGSPFPPGYVYLCMVCNMGHCAYFFLAILQVLGLIQWGPSHHVDHALSSHAHRDLHMGKSCNVYSEPLIMVPLNNGQRRDR